MHVSDMQDDGSTLGPQSETHWFSESGVIDLFLMLGPTVGNVFFQYRQLTGSTPLPPVYHYTKWHLDFVWYSVRSVLCAVCIHSYGTFAVKSLVLKVFAWRSCENLAWPLVSIENRLFK